jgi:hypothetical protein
MFHLVIYVSVIVIKQVQHLLEIHRLKNALINVLIHLIILQIHKHTFAFLIVLQVVMLILQLQIKPVN